MLKQRWLYRFVAFVLTFSIAFLNFVGFENIAKAESVSSTDTEFTSKIQEADNGFEKAIKTLTALGFLKDTFQPESNITRAELADIIARMLGVDIDSGSVSSEPLFKDVPTEYWAYASINAVSKMKIINGLDGGQFQPEDPVTYEQAIKIIVCALGYSLQAEHKGGYPTGYLLVASDKKITKDAEGKVGQPVTGNIIAKIIYNALEVDIMDQTGFGSETEYSSYEDKTILDKTNVFKKTGVMTATADTTLLGNSSLKEDEVEIEGEAYKIGKTSPKDYLGYQVVLYAKKEIHGDKDTLIYIEPEDNKNHIITVKADNIDAVTMEGGMDKSFKYWIDKDKDDKSEEVTISKKADMVYNGKAFPTYTLADLKPDEGQVVLLDNNDDNEYDTIFVTSYAVYIADSIELNSYIITDKGNKSALLLEPNNSSYTVNITKKGSPLELSEIREWNVLSVAESKPQSGKTIRNVIVSDELIQGKIAEVDDDEVVIDETKYKVVKGINKEALSVNTEGIFYLDFEGKIAAYDTNLLEGKKYGYIVDAANAPGVDSRAEFKLLIQEDGLKSFKTSDKVTLDGDSVKGSEVIGKISSNGTKPIRQLIGYKLNSQGDINFIDTKYQGPNENTDGLEISGTNNTRRYNKNARVLFVSASSEGTFSLNPDAVVFFVPKDPSIRGLDKAYYVRGVTSLVHDDSYISEIYNADDFRTSNLCVVSIASSATIKTSAKPILIDKVTTVIDEDGEQRIKIYGVGEEKNFEKLFSTTPDPNSVKPQDLKFGDVIRYSLDSFGDVITMDRQVDSAPDKINAYNESATVYDNEPLLVYGRILKVRGYYITIVASAILDESQAKHWNINKVPVYVCENKGNRKVRIGTTADVEAGKRVFLRASDGYVTDVIVFYD